MEIPTQKGLFIVLEGIDNCGKTTQSNLLKGYFEQRDRPVVQTREPGGTKVGEKIREILLQDRVKILDPRTQTLLFYASRTEFLKNVVKPNIERGVNVIADRFEASTYVYQGYVQGVSTGYIDMLHEFVVASSGCQPDLYIVLDIPIEESRKRAHNSDNAGQEWIYEKQGIEFARQLREGYLRYAVDYDVYLVDGTPSKEIVFESIVALVENHG